MRSFCGLHTDVFISYAHADNTFGWITQFEDQFRNRLRELDRNAPFEVWRDPRLGGSYILTDEIDTRIKSSGIFISILSPNGLDSEWCQRERKLFEQAAAKNGGFRVGNKARAVRITKAPCERNKDRDLFGTVGHDFCRHNSQTGFFEEFDPSSPEFRALVLQIAQETFELLKQLREKRGQIPPSDLTLYLAAAAPGSISAKWRQRAVDELRGAWNCRVLPEDPDPDQLSKAAVNAFLRECDLALHWATAPADSTDKLQWECALSFALKRVICEVSPEGSPPATPDWFSEKPVDAAAASVERIRATAPDQLIQYLEDFINARRQTPGKSPDPRALVYVICGPDEREGALLLKHCLENESRFSAILPIREAEDGKTRLNDHRGWLKTCHAALVYWGGSSDEAWFREQQKEIIGAQLKRRNRPLRALCLALSGRADPAANSLPNLPLQKIASVECAGVRRHFGDLLGKGASA